MMIDNMCSIVAFQSIFLKFKKKKFVEKFSEFFKYKKEVPSNMVKGIF
jgi:hypothetical protein